MKTFGCEAFVHIDSESRTKLEEQSKKCAFIGYNVNGFGYLLWDYENNKIIRSKDFIFNEKVIDAEALPTNQARAEDSWIYTSAHFEDILKFER